MTFIQLYFQVEVKCKYLEQCSMVCWSRDESIATLLHCCYFQGTGQVRDCAWRHNHMLVLFNSYDRKYYRLMLLVSLLAVNEEDLCSVKPMEI